MFTKPDVNTWEVGRTLDKLETTPLRVVVSYAYLVISFTQPDVNTWEVGRTRGKVDKVQLSLVSFKTMACIAGQTESDRNFFFYFPFARRYLIQSALSSFDQHINEEAINLAYAREVK